MKHSNPRRTNGAMPMVDLSSFWSLTEESLFGFLHSSPTGLSESESRSRLSQSEAETIEGQRRSSLSIVLAQLNNLIVLLLLVSAILSYFLDDSTNAFIILVIIVLSGVLSFWQERSAADAVARIFYGQQEKV